MSDIWPQTKLGDCCDILDSMRVPLNSEQRDTMKGDIPYYGANGLQGYIDKFIFDEPLILLAEDGGYFDEYETRPIAYRISGKSWVNNHAHILRAISGNSFCQDYIFYCLEHKNINPFIKGGTRAKLNQSELREILIPKAPEPQQRRIAEILSTLDETIEHTEALIAKTHQVKAGLMHDLFTRGVTPDGHLRPPNEQAPDLYKESSCGWIPKEWEVKALGALAEIVSGVTLGSKIEIIDGIGVPYLRVANVQDGYFDLSEVKTVRVSQTQFEKLQLRHGDVLMNEGGDFDKLGRGSVWQEEIKPCIHQNHVFRVRPRKGSCDHFTWRSGPSLRRGKYIL